MDKISSILPSNHRVKSVDIDDSHPVRPGVESYGRPVGTTANGREQLRNHLAEQKAAEKALDSMSFSEQGKLAAGNDATELEAPKGSPMPMKSFIDEMSGEHMAEQGVTMPAAPKQPQAPPKPSFFVDPARSTKAVESNRPLDKYA